MKGSPGAGSNEQLEKNHFRKRKDLLKNLFSINREKTQRFFLDLSKQILELCQTTMGHFSARTISKMLRILLALLMVHGSSCFVISM